VRGFALSTGGDLSERVLRLQLAASDSIGALRAAVDEILDVTFLVVDTFEQFGLRIDERGYRLQNCVLDLCIVPVTTGSDRR
jgi:hypothetical protein